MAARSYTARWGFLWTLVLGGICYSTVVDLALSHYRISGGGAGPLADSIEGAIRRGALKPGQDLPSVRRIAAELELSPTTVSAALAQLRARGLVASRERSRSFVAWR